MTFKDVRESLLSSINRYLPKGQFGRGVMVLAGSTALGQALVLLSSPILTRMYSVNEFGNFQMYLSWMLFALPIAAGRYEIAILLPEKNQMAAHLTILCVGLILISSVASGILFWMAAWMAPTLMGNLKSYFWLVPATVFGASLYLVMSQWTLRQKNYAQIGRSKISQSIGTVSTQLIMGGAGFGLFGLLVGDAIGRLSGTFSFVRTAWSQHKNLFRQVKWTEILAAAKRYRHFPLVSSFSSLINAAGFALPPILIGALYSSQVLGWYSLVDRVMGVPTILIGSAISQVYMVEAASLIRSEPTALRSLFMRTAGRLACLGLLPFLGIFLLGPILFPVVFGAQWSESGQYARWLAAGQYVGFVAWPLIPTLNLLERQFWQLAWDIARMVVTISAILLAHKLGWPARYAMGGFAAALLITYLAHLMLSLLAISRHAGLNIKSVPE